MLKGDGGQDVFPWGVVLSSQDDVAPDRLRTPPPAGPVDKASEPAGLADAGPTGPRSVEPTKDRGPSTGGYDDHSPSTHPTNEKGGYGAG